MMMFGRMLMILLDLRSEKRMIEFTCFLLELTGT